MTPVLDRVRYFFEDLSATALVAVGAVLGMALGVMVMTQLTSGTPYSETDLDRAASTSMLTSKPGSKPAAADTSAMDADVAQLEEKVADLRALLASNRDDSGAQQDTLDKLTEKLDRIMARRKYLKEQLTELADRPTTATVSGTLATTSTYTLEQKPWPATCAGVAAAFQVKVIGGEEGATFLGEAAGADTVKRTESDESVTITCRFSYTLTLPAPLKGDYTFSARSVTGGSGEAVTVTDKELGEGSAPALAAAS